MHTVHLGHGVGSDLDDEAAELPDGGVVLRTDVDAGGDFCKVFGRWDTLGEHPDVEGVGRAIVGGGATHDVVL